MKIVKRDGRIVDYDSEKILLAIGKANNEVEESHKISIKQIEKIIAYIESLNKKRILVEDVQDIIEQKLMEFKKYELAKTYIIYRHNRALIRKSNSTDENILGIIKSQNKQMIGDSYKKNSIIAAAQRDIIAGEISKDITKRVLLPEKIIKAHEDGLIYFHDMDYFIHSIISSTYVNIGDMLDNGTVMNNKLIESPNSFQVACNVTTQILSQVASGQYGSQTIDVSKLSLYLHKSALKIKKQIMSYQQNMDKDVIKNMIDKRVKKELSNGIQTLIYQINTLMTSNGRSPFVTLFMYLNKEDPHLNETAMIIDEVIKQWELGIKNSDGIYVEPEFPKLVYVLSNINGINDKYSYITDNLLKVTKTRSNISFISELKMRELFNNQVYGPVGNGIFLSPYKEDNKYLIDGRFTQGMVSINLVRVALLANSAEKKFFEILDEKIDLCIEALMCRYRALLNVLSDVSPIHWQYGAITRINKNEKIDNYLRKGFSNLILGYSGLLEASKIIDADNDIAVKAKILHFINEKIKVWNKINEVSIVIYCNPNVGLKFLKSDLEKYGIIKNVTDKESYDDDLVVNMENIKPLQVIEEMSKGGYPLKILANDINGSNIELIYKNIWYIEVKR